MLSGFNTNFRYRGVLFHVQTEDSGVSNPHIITHLFHGGNILASVKRDYSAKVDSDDLELVVKQLMEAQHKEMLRQLKRGAHDDVILERLGPDAFAPPGESSETAATLPPHPREESSSDASDAFEAITPLPEELAPPEVVAPDATANERMARAFGESIVSQKPLDEVVLDYLVENARKRKRSTPSELVPGPPRQRGKSRLRSG